MKKGQMSIEQVITYVLAFIITAAILFLGYKGVNTIIENQGKIELVKFQNDFRQIIDDTSYSYGSSKRINLMMPKGYDELCLIDKDMVPVESESNMSKKNKVILDQWRDINSKDNAFLLKRGSLTPQSFYAGNMSVDGNGNGGDDRYELGTDMVTGDYGFLCIKSSGSTFSAIVKGGGRHALVMR